jgi:hypothetical protein
MSIGASAMVAILTEATRLATASQKLTNTLAVFEAVAATFPPLSQCCITNPWQKLPTPS